MATACVEAVDHQSANLGALIEGTEAFRSEFNRGSFEFRHRLINHPLFRLERLLELTRETQKERPSHVYYDAGVTDLNQRWDKTPRPEFSATEAIERIQKCGAWIILRHAEKCPEYAEVQRECMQELEHLAGVNLARVMKFQEVIVFVTSPKRITTYHIDRECTLLLQLQGEKQINIFDRNDREVLSEEEIETFWSVDHNAPRYKPELQSHAKIYRLKPGTGVHIPVNAPHWVQNGDNISVSVNMNFQYRDIFRANLYRSNYLLRKMGFNPTPPGVSRLKDSVKSVAVIPAVWAKNVSRGRKPWA